MSQTPKKKDPRSGGAPPGGGGRGGGKSAGPPGGESGAFRQLEPIEAMRSKLRSYFWFRLVPYGRLRDVEDLTHNTLLKAAEKIARERLVLENPPAYLLRFADGIWRNFYRKEIGKELRTESMEGDGERPGAGERLGDDAPKPDEETERKDQRARIEKVLKALPERDRAVIYIRYVEGYRAKEAAKRLGIQPAEVDMRLYRARRRFADLFRRTCGGHLGDLGLGA